ncbi:hypothetical protein [Sporisorium scitamineum]|uniref:Uncharacterized protein n=1 Tax=Sporisorium scitamineum TaxID=49012 RepID=A0A0F7S8R3_9BASI|nr:hypothetical protein [Sporisorium scitamineum]
MHSSSAQASAALSIPKSDDADQIEQGIDQEMDDTHEPSAQVEEDLIDVEDPPPKMMSAGTQDVQHTLSKQEFTQSCQAQQQATTNLSISLAASMHTPKQANLQTTTLTIVHPSQDVQNLQQLALAAVASTPNIDPGASNSNQHLSSNSNMALPPPPSTLLPQDLGRHPGIRF